MPVHTLGTEGEIFTASLIASGSTEPQDWITLLTSGHRVRVREFTAFVTSSAVFSGGGSVELWRGSTGGTTGAAITLTNVTNPSTGAPTGANFSVTAQSSVTLNSSASAKLLAVGGITPDGFTYRPPVEEAPVISSSARFHARGRLSPAASYAVTLTFEDLGKMPGF
jgi:hypothetical protein